jgi:hypothetical protein
VALQRREPGWIFGEGIGIAQPCHHFGDAEPPNAHPQVSDGAPAATQRFTVVVPTPSVVASSRAFT